MLKLSWILLAITRKMTIQYAWSFRQRIRNGQYWTRTQRLFTASAFLLKTQTRQRSCQGHCTYRTFHRQGRRKPAYSAFTNNTHTWIFWREDWPSKRPTEQRNLPILLSSVGADQSSLKTRRRLFANSRNRRFLPWYSSFFINEGPDSYINPSWRFRLKGPKENGNRELPSYFWERTRPEPWYLLSRGIHIQQS